MKKVIFIVAAMLGVRGLHAQHTLEEIWRSEPVFEFSEGVIPDATGKFLYVSNTIGNPMEKDGKGSISTIGFDGKIITKD